MPRMFAHWFLGPKFSVVYCYECNVEFCIQCHCEWHPHKTFEQITIEEKRSKDPVLLAREKMSKATIQKYPSCHIQYIKWDGCNKIICPQLNC